MNILVLSLGYAQKRYNQMLRNFFPNDYLIGVDICNKDNNFDICLHASTHNPNSVLKSLAKHGINSIDAIFTGSSGYKTYTKSILDVYFGLPGISPKIAKYALNKFLLHKVMTKNKINHRVSQILNLEKEKTPKYNIKTPIIIKPLKSESNKNIVFCNDLKKLKSIFKAFSQKGIKEILIEEDINGEELIVNAIINEGKIIFMSLFSKECYKYPDKRFLRSLTVVKEKEKYNRVNQLLKQIIDIFKLDYTSLELDIILTDKNIEVLEIDFCYPTCYLGLGPIQKAYEIDLFKLYFLTLLGKKINKRVKSSIYPKNSISLSYIYLSQKEEYNTIKEKLLNCFRFLPEGIEKSEIFENKHRFSVPPNSNLDRIGYFWGEVRTAEKINSILDKM